MTKTQLIEPQEKVTTFRPRSLLQLSTQLKKFVGLRGCKLKGQEAWKSDYLFQRRGVRCILIMPTYPTKPLIATSWLKSAGHRCLNLLRIVSSYYPFRFSERFKLHNKSNYFHSTRLCYNPQQFRLPSKPQSQ